MRKMLAWCYEAIRRARQVRADRETLARLDAHTLRDIGLESWSSHLTERVDQQRQRLLLRLAAARIGNY